MLIHLHIVYGCFHTTADLSGCNGESMSSPQSPNCLALYGGILLASVVDLGGFEDGCYLSKDN
jgi:hypothetical protein